MGGKWVRIERLEKAEARIKLLRHVLFETKKFIPGLGTGEAGLKMIDALLAEDEEN